MCDFVFKHNLSQIVNSPTHICGNILDLILTNCEDEIYALTVHPLTTQLIPSDHFPISCKVSIISHTATNVIPRFVYNYSKTNYHGLSLYMSSCDFTECYMSTNVEEI